MGILSGTSIYKENYRNIADGIKLMEALPELSVKAAFLDPQYRGVLDKLRYGNEGKSRGKGRYALQQMDELTIVRFIHGVDRVLQPSGHLFLWVDKYHLCTGVMDWFADTKFTLVDMITWNKGRIGMGYRTRRTSEYLIIFQKQPTRAKGCWTDHSIPDVWTEKVTKKHPHSKPAELQKRLILATTSEGDYVLDPASGGYSVFDCCKASNRNFIGGDIDYGENGLAGSYGDGQGDYKAE